MAHPGKSAMYPTIAPQGGGSGYARPPNYVVHRVEAAHPPPPAKDGYGNPYVFMDDVTHGPNCWHGGPVSPDRKRKNRLANAVAAAFVVCWCFTWPCHGPCCCGL